MSIALSLDLRVRVLAAVALGMTHRAAGGRFGVSAASVSRWRTREREQGDPRAKALGGDWRSHHIDAHMHAVLAALGPEGDRTIEEMRRALADQGLVFGFRCTVSSPATRSRAKRMARPVRKRFMRGDLTGLRQRIRSRGLASAKMEFRALWAS